MNHMTKNNISKTKNNFILKQIRMISELFEAEEFFNTMNILSRKTIQNQYFILFNKEWLENWKIIVDYEKIKDKYIKTQKINDLKNEIYNVFINLNIKEKLEELDKMDCSNYKKDNLFEIFNLAHLRELYNLIPITNALGFNFSNYIKDKVIVNGNMLNGKIYINEPLSKENKDTQQINKKIMLLIKENEKNYEYKKYIITLEKDANINIIIKMLKNINIEEFINIKQSEEGNEIFKKAKIIKIEDLKQIEKILIEEEERKKRGEEEKNEPIIKIESITAKENNNDGEKRRKEEEEEEERIRKEKERKRIE